MYVFFVFLHLTGQWNQGAISVGLKKLCVLG